MCKTINKGFISILALLVMATILVSSLFLSYSSNLEYMILNSSKNNTQAFYLAEGKILMVLNKDKYYKDMLLPRLEEYLKKGRIADPDKKIIILDDEDMIEGDNYNRINLSFSKEDNRRLIELQTQAIYNNIKRKAIAKLTIINEIFEMGLPVVSTSILKNEKTEIYMGYMDYLQQEIQIPPLNSDMMGIEAMDYDRINIIKRIDNQTNVELYRNSIEMPIKGYTLNREKVFLLAQNTGNGITIVSILSEVPSDLIVLKGIMYVEGDLKVYNDMEFNGILIVNGGKIFVEPNIKAKFNGIVLGENAEELLDYEDVEVNYSIHEIKNNGIYLPGFIDPKVEVIKIN
ncbi:hypothetical protein [Clostridium sp. Cult3]|uniref:hypothetical protein n=1 Tax=Clostridium sp. Cult3 TaxID=2079004 RepID=UPI001F3585F2|nr:hypothetical protein [Clostridium sp. Cult3]MCF6460079.1 hypothetical protein [Clostridium sp. Cult3]